MIDIDADDKVDLPNPSANADIVMQESSSADALVLARGASSGAEAALRTGTSSSLPTPPVTNMFALHRVPEDQVGASKETLIQLEVMSE